MNSLQNNTTHTTLKNASFNFMGYVYPMLLAFIVAPITVNLLGVRNYGLYIFISTLLSILGLLDLGVSTAISRSITKYFSINSKNDIKKVIGSANSIFTLMGILGLLIFTGIGFLGHFVIPPEVISYQNYPQAFLFAGLLFFVTSFNNIFTIIPSALGRFDLSNKIGFLSITLQQALIVIVVTLNYSIAAIFMSQFFIAILNGFIGRYISKKLIPYISYSFIWDKKEVFSFYKFGIATFINNIAGSSLNYLDRIFIPFLLGPSNLTYYTLPGNITSKTPGISNTLSNVLFPLTTQLESLGEKEKIKILYVRSTRLIIVVSSAITVSLISFPYELLFYWINKDVAEKGYVVLIILALTNLILAIMSPISNLLLGLGKLKSLSITSVITALINALLLFILTPRFGLTGAAFSYILSLPPALWLIYRVEKKYLQLNTGRMNYYISISSKIFTVGLLIYAFNIFVSKALINDIFTLLFFAGFSIILFIILYKIFGFFEKQDVDDIMAFVHRHLVLLNKNEK
jgi:O-antigen/teichoic acid export membrane protein